MPVSTERMSTVLKGHLASSLQHPLGMLHADELALTPGDPLNK